MTGATATKAPSALRALLSQRVCPAGHTPDKGALMTTDAHRLLVAITAGGGATLAIGGLSVARGAHSVVCSGDGSRYATIVRLIFGLAAIRRGRGAARRRENVGASCRTLHVMVKGIVIKGRSNTVSFNLRVQKRPPPIF